MAIYDITIKGASKLEDLFSSSRRDRPLSLEESLLGGILGLLYKTPTSSLGLALLVREGAGAKTELLDPRFVEMLDQALERFEARGLVQRISDQVEPSLESRSLN